jgi:hypothetical protein
LRVEIDVSPDRAVVSWEGGRHCLSPAALAVIRDKIGRSAPVLTRVHGELDAALRQAGALLWDCTLGEAGVPLEAGRPVELEIRSFPELRGWLAAIPWECMVEPRMEVPLAYHPHVTPFRSSAADAVQEAPADEGSVLRALVLAPGSRAAADLPALRSAEEIEELSRSLQALVFQGVADLEVLGPGSASLLAAREALERRRPHVLHYIGHSRADGATGETRFQLDGAAGAVFVPERALLSLLLDLPAPPRLLVLNSCHSAGPVLSAGLPAKLRRFGLRAVIAMQSPIFDRAALLFAHRLYHKLAQGASIGAACQAGRRELVREEPARGDWILPVLYTDQPAACVLRVVDGEEGGASAPAPALRMAVQGGARLPLPGLRPYGEEDADGFFGRAEEAARAADLLRESGLLILHGGHGVGKSSLVQAAIVPALRRAGFHPVVVSRWSALAAELEEKLGAAGAAGEPVALLLDQAEGALEQGEAWSTLRPLLARSGPASPVLLAVRDGALDALRERLAESLPEPVRELALPAMTRAGSRRVIDQLRRRFVLEVDAGLEGHWLAVPPDGESGAGQGEVALPVFSLLLTRLAGSLPPAAVAVLDLPLLEKAGGLRGILAEWLRQMVDAFGETDGETARLILTRLVDRETGLPAVRLGRDLAGSLDPRRAREVITALTGSHLVRILPGDRHVLAHPGLAAEILERFRSSDLAWRQALRTRACAEIGVALETGRVEPERLDEVEPGDLSAEELAAWLGWTLLRRVDPLPPEAVAGVADLRLRQAFQFLWRSTSPDLLARALTLAAGLSPYRRGAPPFLLAAAPGGEPAARFAAEAMLPALARKAAGDDATEAEKAGALRLLLRDAIPEGVPLNHPDLLGRSRALGLFAGDDDGPLAEVPNVCWPGMAPPLPLLSVVGALLTIALAWLLWPDGTLSPAHLPGLLFLAGTAGATAWAYGRALARDHLLFPPAARGRGELSRISWRLQDLCGAMSVCVLVPVTCRLLGSSTVALSDRIHGAFLHPSLLWQPFAREMAARPAGSRGLAAAAWGLAKIALTPVTAIFVFYLIVICLCVVLALPVAVTGGCQLAAGRALHLRGRTGTARCAATLVLAAALGAGALPLAFSIGARLLAWGRPHLWRPELFFGEQGFDLLLADWRALSGASMTSLAGALVPLLAAALIAGTARRRLRLAHPGLSGLWIGTPGPVKLWPLITEGAPEALATACLLLRKHARPPGVEMQSFLAGLAAGREEVFLAEVPAVERETLAAHAHAAIRAIEAGPPGWARAVEATWVRVLRGFGVRGVEPGRWDDPWTWAGAPGSGESRRRVLTSAAATALLLLAVLGGLWHVGLFAAGRLLDLLLPLSAPVGTSLFDTARSVGVVVRVGEVAALAALVYGVARLRRRWKRKPEEETG